MSGTRVGAEAVEHLPFDVWSIGLGMCLGAKSSPMKFKKPKNLRISGLD